MRLYWNLLPLPASNPHLGCDGRQEVVTHGSTVRPGGQGKGRLALMAYLTSLKCSKGFAGFSRARS